ncbi:MAG: hypothetical protein GEU93_10415 [Propionibacteriales bacterium]|nr:hypothetical protein [Propionibacteriales bacterium]
MDRDPTPGPYLAESMSGFAEITGLPDGPPTLPPFGLADGIAGMAAASAVVMALYHRDARGGTGQVIGPVRMQNVLFRMSETPGAIRWTGRRLGADTDAVFMDELGVSEDRLRELRERGAVA